jgi:DNA sulfur modification protein DndD
MKVKFSEIEFEDFRQFYGKQTLRFATGKDNNVTLINGVNGAGKTHTLEAINWCLYGEYIKNRGAIVSKEKAFHADFGDVIECKVSIWYTHEGEECVAIRKGRARKVKHDPYAKEKEDVDRYKGFTLQMLPEKEDDFKVLKRTDAGMKELPDPTITIDRALPINAKQYFLFDGEKIDQLSKPEHDADVKEAVRNILQLPAIERAMDHLKTIKKDFMSKLKKTAKNYSDEDLFKALEDIDNGIDGAKKAQEDSELKLSQVRELKSKIENDLRKFSAIKELTNRRDDLKQNYERCQARIRSNKSKIAETLASSSLILCKTLVEDTAAPLDERRQKGHIPPGIREPFIKDLIEKGVCICGNDLRDGSDGKCQLEKFMIESRTNTLIAEELNELIGDLTQIKRAGAQLPETLKKSLAEWISSRDELDDIAGRLEDVHNQIEKFGHADIEKLGKSLRECEKDERDILRDLAEIETALRNFRSYRAEIEKALRQITKTKTASGEFARLTELAEMSHNVFQNVYEEFARRKRGEIEEELKRIFYRLIWKKEQFPDVRLTENYSLQIYDRYGSPAREELSAGERQILSLSFITSMAFVIGGTLPLIMDTPFGRLSSEHRANIVKEVPDLTNQWVLLVQDEEVSTEMLDILRPRVGKEYMLRFEDGCTAIEEV